MEELEVTTPPVSGAEAEPAPVEVVDATPELVAEKKVDEGAPLKALLEAVVYILDEPKTAAQLAEALGRTVEEVTFALRDLMQESAQPHRGIAIREVAGGYKMSTKPEFHEEVRAFVKNLKPPLKLSLAALETLAVIAYKQPITAPEITEIRGVQGAGVLKTLLDRKLITTAGRKAVIGKPILYKTTKEFLLQFGLKDLAELPTLKEFEELRRLAMSDDTPEEAPAAETAPAPPPAAEAAEPAESSPTPQPPAEPEPVAAAENG